MNQNKKIIFSVTLFTIILAIIVTPVIIPVFGVVGNTTTFNVTLTVNSGSPTITNVTMTSDSPNEGTTKVVHFYFNASHPNGVANIPFANAQVRINQSGTTLSSSGCIVSSTDSITWNRFDCSVTINYYNLPGSWTINATIVDLAANRAMDTTALYTNGNTYGITLKTQSITFGGAPGATVGAGENPQYLNNTGNIGFNKINLTAFTLQSGSNILGVGNFTVNTTDGAGAGQILYNNSPVNISSSVLAVSGSRNMYIYLSIPNGLANGTYNATSPWVVTVS